MEKQRKQLDGRMTYAEFVEFMQDVRRNAREFVHQPPILTPEQRKAFNQILDEHAGTSKPIIKKK